MLEQRRTRLMARLGTALSSPSGRDQGYFRRDVVIDRSHHLDRRSVRPDEVSTLIKVMLVDVGVEDRGGALHVNRLLPAGRLLVLSDLLALRATRESVIGGHVACASAFLPLACNRLDRCGVIWPQEFAGATRYRQRIFRSHAPIMPLGLRFFKSDARRTPPSATTSTRWARPGAPSRSSCSRGRATNWARRSARPADDVCAVAGLRVAHRRLPCRAADGDRGARRRPSVQRRPAGPVFSPEVLEPVLAALAARRHGQDVVLRALSRYERSAGSLSAF